MAWAIRQCRKNRGVAMSAVLSKKKSSKAEAVRNFVVFFLLSAFVLTSNFLLFFKFTDINTDRLFSSALLTFGNVIFISVLFALFDMARRYFTVTRPVRRIQEGLEKVIEGDFSVRIPYVRGEDSGNRFDDIIKSQNKMIEELGSVETLRTDFISNVSHELKTPLAVIQNYSTLMQTPGLKEAERLEYSEKITEQTKKLTSLIGNILKLNKLENQQLFPKAETMNLTEAVCECMLAYESVWEKKKIEIETELDDEAVIEGDKELLSLVWNNLMSNALKFTPEGGKVTIETGRVGAEDGKNRAEAGKNSPVYRAYVRITDSGCGMDENVAKNIFKKFYQGDSSHKSEGNGLGLALAKRAVDIHGGSIEVDSRIGFGTAITVFLP